MRLFRNSKKSQTISATTEAVKAAGPPPAQSNLLPHVTTGLVAALALFAFALSYDNLLQFAHGEGIGGYLVYTWPLIVDGFIVTASVSVLDATMHRRNSFKAWALVGLFTLISIGCNLGHSRPGLPGYVVAALPPVALFLAFELLMGQIKRRLFAAEQRAVAAAEQKRQEQEASRPVNAAPLTTQAMTVVPASMPAAPQVATTVPSQRATATQRASKTPALAGSTMKSRSVTKATQPAPVRGTPKAEVFRQLDKVAEAGTEVTIDEYLRHFPVSRRHADRMIGEWKKATKAAV